MRPAATLFLLLTCSVGVPVAAQDSSESPDATPPAPAESSADEALSDASSTTSGQTDEEVPADTAVTPDSQAAAPIEDEDAADTPGDAPAETRTAPAPVPLEEVSGRGIACWGGVPVNYRLDAVLDEPIELTSGDADIEADGSASFTGPIEMRSETRTLTAGAGSYDAETGLVNGDGGFAYEDPVNKITGDSVEYNAKTGQFHFDDPTFVLGQVPARGEAKSIKLIEPGVIELRRVRYTSCPEGNDDWLLRARSLEINTNTGMGTATGASLSFKGVPFFYWPYFTYPVTDDRRSGLLFPRFGSSDKRGLEYTQPIYWNIRPNMDATFVPRYMQDRGLQMGTEYRFLTRKNEGILWGDYLSDDDEFGEDRWRYEVETESYLPFGWRARIDAEGVSDQQYFEDMTANVGKTSQVALSRQGIVEYADTTWQAFVKVQDYQNIDPFITDEDEPYFQAPQIVLNGDWYNGWLGTQYGFDSEAIYFTRDDSVKGLRTHLQPRISRPFRYRGIYFVPEAAFDYTFYDLEDREEGGPELTSDSPDRAAPILTLDSGVVFERLSGKNQQRVVTFEPRALYTYIPERNQDDLPVFDTILADFNLIQLFEPNRYVGYDRLGDANQFAIGLTSRVLDSNTGRELLTATIGQQRLLETSEVILPGEETSSSRKSSYIAELGVRLSSRWSVDARYQLDAEERETERSSIRLRFRPGENKALNLGYRYTRERLEQTDFSFAWPLGQHWNAVGRYNYSIEDSEVLDEYLGIEYSSCCWGVRVLARRSVERSSGEQSDSISVQFVLKGLAGFGSESGDSLRRDIIRE